MRYRVKVVTYKNDQVCYFPQKKFKYWPFWISFTVQIAPGEWAYNFTQTYNQACGIIQDEINKRNKRKKKNSFTMIEFNENGIIQRNDD